MTKTKGQRLINELIEKYGDVVITKQYDYYAYRLLTEEEVKAMEQGKPHPVDSIENHVVKEIHLSDLTNLTSHADYKAIQKIASGSSSKVFEPVIVEATKKQFDTEEQKNLRERIVKCFNTMTKYITNS